MDQDLRRPELGLDRVAKRVRDLVRSLEARAGAELEVEVDERPRAGAPRAELVVTDDLRRRGPLLGDRRLDPVELSAGRRLIDERPPRSREDPEPREHDRRGDGKRGD